MKREYIARINRTFDYIERNLEKTITLEELADAANFSRFHFNRIFHAMVGETPFQFIQRLRLEKAASLFAVNKESSIYEIALLCGFSDISTFSRNFKNQFKISASQYRKNKIQKSNLSQPNSNIGQPENRYELYFCPAFQTNKWRTNMNLNKSLEVKELPQMTVAYIRNIGPWNGDKETYRNLRNKLFTWAGARGLMGSSDFKYLILYHDDPNVAPNEKLRMSLCITVPPETEVSGEIGKMQIEAAKYAVARFELTENDFQNAWEWLFGEWMPNSGYQPDAKHYFETYPEEPKDGRYLVDFCVPVRPI